MTIARLRERRDLSCRLAELSERQRLALGDRDYESLIGILSEKQTLLERLAVLSAAARNWSAERVFVSPGERAEGEALLNEGTRLLGEAARLETDDIAELTAQRNAAQAALQEISSAGQVHSAYRDALAPATHRSLDVGR